MRDKKFLNEEQLKSEQEPENQSFCASTHIFIQTTQRILSSILYQCTHITHPLPASPLNNYNYYYNAKNFSDTQKTQMPSTTATWKQVSFSFQK